MAFESERDLMDHAAALPGLRLGTIDPALEDVIPSNRTKGLIGQAIETWFGVETNSTQGPDFPELGIELKVLPVRNTRRGWSAKERVAITQINYAHVLATPYEESHLREKTRNILFVFYEYMPFQAIGSFRITESYLWHPTPFEEDALRSTYNHVRTATAEGRAHELSGSDTPFIETVTKGSGSNEVTQPRASHPAKRRAFAFKQSAMSQIYRDIRAGARERPDAGPSTVDTIDVYLAAQVEPWIGRRFEEIQRHVAPETVGRRDKSVVAAVGRRVLGAEPRSMSVAVLERRGITVRTTRVSSATMRPYEATSFPAIRFEDVLDMTWETSPERDLITDMVFVAFAGSREDHGDLRLLGSVRWRPDADDLTAMALEWEQLMGFVRSGNLADRPTAISTRYFHIRPHGADSADVAVLPNGRAFVKSSFWLNQDRVRDIVKSALG